MTIIKRPKLTAVEAFISDAPDGTQAKGLLAGKQAQISLAMPPELLAKVDAAAQALSLSRAGYIKMVLSNATKD